MSSPSTNITSVLKETRQFPPTKEFAERAHVICEGAAACAVAAALSPFMAARGHRKIVAVVSGGNIDLHRFATLVGACA